MIGVPLAVEDANSKLSDILCYIRVEESVENGSVNIYKYRRASLVFEWCNQSTNTEYWSTLLVVLHCLLNSFHLQ